VHNTKVGETEEKRIVVCKLESKHRSARFIRDKLELLFHRDTVRRVLVRLHLSRITLPPVKRVERFEAPHPKALWQIDIMGKTHFPLVGELYLICAMDDHSRFIPYGQWFYRQYGINIYQVMYKAFIRYGLPEAILSNQGPQFKPRSRAGEAHYQWYAQQLGIKPLYARKPQTKGKIEGLFRFVQRDFVLENVHLTMIKEVNETFLRCLDNYNFNHQHEGINKQCPADLYTESLRRLSREELEFILVHEEPRRVVKTAAITYYGHYYQVPDEYIKRRVWTKLKGTNLTVEYAGEVIARHTLREERYQEVPKDHL